ncbi:flagellar export protein FliJ [Pelosinus sp. IPA-1]|uniref:flagellar export protein FliJ n=1 Tax=Pelosinus sp. IPA-1 TaxID=3029569 RepID=UPI002436272E|nr:flagellar export protein FliJ [Pelosinus sp. IPA-1]GMA99763.1 hypothetical protein PIPA1_25630 [Pelosinus sp. IPA-1]
MQSFTFRLETLLKFRKMQKEQVQIAFWQATNQFQLEKQKLVELESKLSQNIDQLRNYQQDALTIETLRAYQYYFEKIKYEITKQKERVLAFDEKRRECLRNLEEAVKNHKLVEKFREKKLQHYRDEMIREEQKMLDEIGLQLYVRES